YRLLLTDKSGKVVKEYFPDPNKRKRLNSWKNCLFSHSFSAPVKSHQIGLTIYYATPRGWDQIEGMVLRYWLYAIAFVFTSWILYWWFYQIFILPLLRIGGAIETMIHSEGAALIPLPKRDVEEAFNQLARNQREVVLGLNIDQIVDTLHDQPDDSIIMDDFLTLVVDPIQRIYPYDHVEAYRQSGHEGEYKPIYRTAEGVVKLSESIFDLSHTDPYIIFLRRGEHEFGALRCWTRQNGYPNPEEQKRIAQEIIKQAENGLARTLTRSRTLTEERNRFGINLATNMGHDLTNIIATSKWDLNTIERAMDLGIVSMDEKKGPFFQEAIDGLKNNLHFLQEMVNIYRSFGYTRRPRYEKFDLVHLVREISHLFTLSTSKRISIQTHATQVIPVEAEPRLLRMAIFNLLGNAAQAIQRNSASNSESRIDLRVTAADEGFVTIFIEDNGPGIRDHAGNLLQRGEISRIFQSGYSTKESESGGGLGLAWVKSIIENFHHGTIQAENMPGGGACFILSFPPKRGHAASWRQEKNPM
ncbi:GHKL domain-containing protein, partial [bacterium]|nr:GHKL domain-containing protein [bacterium]